MDEESLMEENYVDLAKELEKCAVEISRYDNFDTYILKPLSTPRYEVEVDREEVKNKIEAFVEIKCSIFDTKKYFEEYKSQLIGEERENKIKMSNLIIDECNRLLDYYANKLKQLKDLLKEGK